MQHDFKHSADDIIADFFEHYGVKGMRWGVKNADRPGPSADHLQFRATKVKGSRFKGGGVKSLSNKELQEFITRAGLEKQFKQVNPTLLKKGQGFIKGVLGFGRTTNEVISFANSPAGKQLKEGMGF